MAPPTTAPYGPARQSPAIMPARAPRATRTLAPGGLSPLSEDCKERKPPLVISRKKILVNWNFIESYNWEFLWERGCHLWHAILPNMVNSLHHPLFVVKVSSVDEYQDVSWMEPIIDSLWSLCLLDEMISVAIWLTKVKFKPQKWTRWCFYVLRPSRSFVTHNIMGMLTSYPLLCLDSGLEYYANHVYVS